MKNFKRQTPTVIALILLLTITISMVALPTAVAHDPPWTIPTNSYVTASPNPVTVGEYVTFVMWVDQNPPTAGGNQGPRWHNCKLDITKPDGSKQVIDGITLRSATANDWYNYVPDQVGTYTIVFSWPGQTLTDEEGVALGGGIPYLGDFFAGSTSEPLYLTVQQEPIAEWQEPPLPTEYWTRPLNNANRGWSVLGSNWLLGSWLKNNEQTAGTAPESAHVLWTQPITPGIAGGTNDAQWSGIPTNVNDYESPWGQPIIMLGKIYHDAPQIGMETGMYGYYCRDLYTGEIIWYKNGTDNGLDNPFVINQGLGSRAAHHAQQYMSLMQGQLYHYASANGQGVLAYLWMSRAGYGVVGTEWYMLDAYTGNWLLTLVNVPGGTSVTDQDGSLLRYSYNRNTGNLLCWNSSQSIPPSAPFGTGQQQWKLRLGGTIDAQNDTFWTEMGVLPNLVGIYDESDILPRSGYTMNLTIQKGLPGSISVLQDENRVPKMIFGSSTTSLGPGLGTALTADVFSAWLVRIDEHVAPYSPYPNKTNTQNTNLGFGATLLWSKDFTVPIPGKNYTWSVSAPDSTTDPVFVLSCKQTRQKWGYDATTGNLLWGPTEPEGAFNYYGMGSNSYEGKILSVGYSGTLYAYDKLTGELLWTYNATSVGRESPYGENYPLSISAVADGKVYLHSSEHSPTKPLWRGSYLRCISLEDGTELWKLLDFNMGLGVADGIIVTGNAYDNLIYGIGKGPSAISVTASPEVSMFGNSVLVKGYITDISPGTEQLVQSKRFPNGVPAVADEDMQAWMEYLYEQQAFPASAKGVEVVLSVLDANNNYREIGTATSNSDGFFSFNWQPDIEGKYTIYASFGGSKSYYPSHAVTAFQVDAPPEATVAPTAAPVSMADQYLLPGIGIIVAAIAIVGAVIVALMLRKK